MKIFRITVQPRAKQEIQLANRWYNRQQKGLGGVKFYHKLKSTFETLRSKPLFQYRYGDIRCAVVKRFAFMVHFRVDEEQRVVRVYGVIHTSLNPDEHFLKD